MVRPSPTRRYILCTANRDYIQEATWTKSAFPQAESAICHVTTDDHSHIIQISRMHSSHAHPRYIDTSTSQHNVQQRQAVAYDTSGCQVDRGERGNGTAEWKACCRVNVTTEETAVESTGGGVAATRNKTVPRLQLSSENYTTTPSVQRRDSIEDDKDPRRTIETELLTITNPALEIRLLFIISMSKHNSQASHIQSSLVQARPKQAMHVSSI